MKKIIYRLSVIIILLGCFVGLDVFSTLQLKKPLFVMGKETNEESILYHGLFYDVHECLKCLNVEVLSKNDIYQCPPSNHEKRAKLTLVGDLLFEQPYYDALDAGEDKALYFNQVKGYFENDDLTIGNMEVVITNGALEVSGEGYSFCAPEYVGEMVSDLDFEILGTTNNHSYDRGLEGLLSTLDYFEKNSDITTVGTYRSQEDRKNYRILNINDIRFGFLAYTYETNIDTNFGDEVLIGYYKDPYTYKVTDESKAIMKEEIEAIQQQCDVVVVLMHWGREFTYEANDEQIEMAHFLNQCGVDLVVGGHSHNIQPIEMIGNEHQTLVYYSLGNFVSADEDLDRTYDDETFDNAYQVGMLSTLEVVLDEKGLRFESVDTEMIVNYFDDEARNWELIPFSNYSEDKEVTHQRYDLGLTKSFIVDMHESVIDKKYR